MTKSISLFKGRFFSSDYLSSDRFHGWPTLSPTSFQLVNIFSKEKKNEKKSLLWGIKGSNLRRRYLGVQKHVLVSTLWIRNMIKTSQNDRRQKDIVTLLHIQVSWTPFHVEVILLAVRFPHTVESLSGNQRHKLTSFSCSKTTQLYHLIVES